MTILRDISFLWSMLHVVALFLLLFQPRYSWRTTLIAGFAGAGVLLVVNVLAMYWLGHGIIMSIAFFTCTIPSLVLFFVLSKYRDGRYFFLFCLTDTVCFWLLQATNFLDRLAGDTYLVLLVSRLILFPLVELIFWRYLRRPYLELQEKQMKDTEKRDKYRVYGELLNTYGYSLQGGERFLKALNYYTNEEIEIPLDETLSAKGNAQKYFDRYNKLKRTYEALSTLLVETREEIDHLESIAQSLDIAMTEADLAEIKEEMREFGYIKKRGPKEKKGKSKSKPFHYVSSDGFHIYIGKNNYQNEELTFKVAQGNDWWFHAKGIPGSHVIVQTKGQELPDRVFEEAGRLAAYYSKGRGGDKVEIDYIQRKHVKKVSGAKPGFVIYHTNYSMVSAPDIQGIREEE